MIFHGVKRRHLGLFDEIKGLVAYWCKKRLIGICSFWFGRICRGRLPVEIVKMSYEREAVITADSLHWKFFWWLGDGCC
jgi:hypothetical protein